MMKQMILTALQNLGFKLEELEEFGYLFHYEEVTYVWIPNDDNEFLSIAVPNVLSMENGSELEFYQIMDKINSTLKYIKANKFGDSMWLFYEREIIGEEDFEQTLPRIIVQLELAHRLMRSSKMGTESDENLEDGNAEHLVTDGSKPLDDNDVTFE